MSLLDLGKDLCDIVLTPFYVAEKVVEVAVKPIADGARTICGAAKALTTDEGDGDDDE